MWELTGPNGKALFATFLAIFLAVACAPPHLQVPRIARAVPTEGEPLDPEAAAKAMARLRGAPDDKPVTLTSLGERAFVEKLKARGISPGLPGTERGGPFWDVFDFAPAGLDIQSAQRSIVDEGVSGFYDSEADEVFVRRGGLGTESERLTLAHEIAHAIQHRIGIRNAYDDSTDAALARRALIEGDANVVAAAYLAQRANRQPGVAIARVRDRLRTMPTADLAKAVHASPAMASAPLLLRSRTTFPYVEGTSLAAALYQSGGVRLMNAALAHPPASTEQVLHPEKYFAGELPLPVQAPRVERGEPVDSGVMGELQTGIYLARCMDGGAARHAAEGWGGDAYVIVRDEAGKLSSLWSTVWDSEDAAIRFEAAVRAREHCANIARIPRVTRRGTSVMVVEGLNEAADPQELLAPAPSQPRSAPPFGAVKLRTIPAPEPQFLHRGLIVNGIFASDAVGVTLPIRSDFSAQVSPSGAELDLWRRGTYGAHWTASLMGRILFFFEPLTVEFETETTERLARSLMKNPHNPLPEREGYGMQLHSGVADVAEMPFEQGGFKVAFVPTCDGEATLVLVGVWQGPYGDLSTDQWFDRVELDGDAPACRYLRTLAVWSAAPAAPASPSSP